MNGFPFIEKPENEEILSYLKGSKERKELEEKLVELSDKVIDIPAIIGGKDVRTGNIANCVMPHDHSHVLAKYHKVGEKEIKEAIACALEAKKTWNELTWVDRASIFKKAADLLSTSWRSTLNAATMLGQSKTVFQAEIDSACEIIDFWRFNTYYMSEIYKNQPDSSRGVWNTLEYRPLEGFVFAVTPFNFTSIGGNLPTSPAIMGNTVLWKPASTAVYSSYFMMKLLQEAGLPDGVINFIPGRGSEVGKLVLNDPDLAGIHFTGSTTVFQNMWRTVGTNIEKYKSYPRIVGETGGKDFIFVHESVDREVLKTAIIRGAFEFQGQKCSAASRSYIPQNVWNEIKDDLIEQTKGIKMGNPSDFTNFMSAVIDKNSFDTIKSYIDYAKSSDDAEILCGGNCDSSKGYFIEPTIVLTTDPKFKTMQEEIFGPVMTIFVYDQKKYEETLHICNETSPYALTGSIFAKDRFAIKKAMDILRDAAGNFYINDKPTGAVVGQQPFGGARASGTNDKAGSSVNLLRWVSMRSIKENFIPSKCYKYSYME
jgi:1-pyrroline-5-carboxylate dehydrogenase